MTATSANCPGCGAPIVFENAATLFVVCPACNAGSYRRDVNLELIGKVAAVASIDSPLALRVVGEIDGREFRVVGQLQLDHGAGPWNEWCILFEDRTSAWLAEAQGQYLITRAVDERVATTWQEIAAGNPIDLGAHGNWIVAERGVGRLTAARGELAENVVPGSVVRYADLSGPDGGFGTLDFGSGERCRAVYLGRRLALEALGLDTTEAEAKLERRVAAARIDCPKCGGAIDVRDPGNSVRIVCPYCSALLDSSGEKARVIEAALRIKTRPRIPIGAKGTWFGADCEVIAWLERSITADGERYPWEEYLLRRADGGYRWLVCSQRHWSFVEPLNLADVARAGSYARCRGRRFRYFSGGMACVDSVLGEVYWEIKVGEKVAVEDYVAPPWMVSFEETGDEKIASFGTYVTPDDVKQAFRLPIDLPQPYGAGAQQPNPYDAGAGAWWKAAGILIAVVLLLDLMFHVVHAGRVVHRASHPVAPPAAEAGHAGTLVSDEFTLPGWRSNAEIVITAPGMDAGRFTVEGSLVESATGAIHDFALRAENEALLPLESVTGTASVRVGGLPGGTYRLRLDPGATHAAPGAEFSVVVKSQVASSTLPLVIALLLLAPPLFLFVLGRAFEARRWAQSDGA